jgi:CubicO group peptidase (beta-lactamase class C family)
VTTAGAQIEGRVAPGFESIAEVFATVIADGGGAFAAFADGEPVVDLWSGDGWHEDTLALVFSGTKGFVAVCVLLLAERGLLDLDAPVARYWPEFAAAGKQGVLVRHAVSHTAGVPGLRRGFGVEDILDGAKMRAAVAAEAPFWAPGKRLAYHALTFGWICDELVRRIDGRSVGRFFADEVAAPLGLELWIGLPESEQPRVTVLERADDYRPTVLDDEPAPLLGALYGDLLGSRFRWNDPALHRAEIPAANAIGTARAIATLYGSLERVLSAETILVGRRELARDACAVTRRPYAFGVGFELQTELAALGPPAAAFGHTGSGGSTHGAWPDERVGFSFVPRRLRAESEDARGRLLLQALHEAVAA